MDQMDVGVDGDEKAAPSGLSSIRPSTQRASNCHFHTQQSLSSTDEVEGSSAGEGSGCGSSVISGSSDNYADRGDAPAALEGGTGCSDEAELDDKRTPSRNKSKKATTAQSTSSSSTSTSSNSGAAGSGYQADSSASDPDMSSDETGSGTGAAGTTHSGDGGAMNHMTTPKSTQTALAHTVGFSTRSVGPAQKTPAPTSTARAFSTALGCGPGSTPSSSPSSSLSEPTQRDDVNRNLVAMDRLQLNEGSYGAEAGDLVSKPANLQRENDENDDEDADFGQEELDQILMDSNIEISPSYFSMGKPVSREVEKAQRPDPAAKSPAPADWPAATLADQATLRPSSKISMERGCSPTLSNAHNRASKTPDYVDIDGIMEARAREQQENAILLQQGKFPPPQLSGFRVTHPMDPRIDLSTVEKAHHLSSAVTLKAQAPPSGLHLHLPQQHHSPTDPSVTQEGLCDVSFDAYVQLMEVVRPFFQAHGFPLVHSQTSPPPSEPVQLRQSYEAAVAAAELPPQEKAESAHSENNNSSSEGFTSFFSTTHSNPNSTSLSNQSTGSKEVLEGSTRAMVASPTLFREATRDRPGEGHAGHNDDHSEDGSMVVLARVKKKHRQRSVEGETSSDTLGEPSVDPPEGAARDLPSYLPRDLETTESGNSETSSDQQRQLEHRNFPLPTRIVTDVSSSNRTDSASNNNTSGTGSAGNSGEGSNQGSSGSGNEGKGSSEELAKEDVSGEGTNEGSDGNTSRYRNDMEGEMHQRVDHSIRDLVANKELEGPTRERKLLDKKRKRIEMRREYEAQQHIESSSSGASKSPSYVRPGKPVTMDQVMGFSKVPRIIVQGTPPFLVVHTNAAYSRLTGIDAHAVVGKPVDSIVKVSDGISSCTQRTDQQEDISSTDSGNPQASGLPDSRARDVSIGRLIAASGFGHLHIVHVNAQHHHPVGRHVTIIEGTPSKGGGAGMRRHDEGSNSTSLMGSDVGNQRQLVCRIYIAPVVSTTDLTAATNAEKEVDQHVKSKMRRPNEDQEQRDATHQRKLYPRQLVTHYVLQLETVATGDMARLGSVDSISSGSTSVEAALVGLSKATFLHQRSAVLTPAQREDESDALTNEGETFSASTESTVHATAIG